MDQRLKTVSAQWLRSWTTEEKLRQHEDKVLLILTLIIGALVGLVVVAFILLTENLALRMYPAGGAAWRRLLFGRFRRARSSRGCAASGCS